MATTLSITKCKALIESLVQAAPEQSRALTQLNQFLFKCIYDDAINRLPLGHLISTLIYVTRSNIETITDTSALEDPSLGLGWANDGPSAHLALACSAANALRSLADMEAGAANFSDPAFWDLVVQAVDLYHRAPRSPLARDLIESLSFAARKILLAPSPHVTASLAETLSDKRRTASLLGALGGVAGAAAVDIAARSDAAVVLAVLAEGPLPFPRLQPNPPAGAPVLPPPAEPAPILESLRAAVRGVAALAMTGAKPSHDSAIAFLREVPQQPEDELRTAYGVRRFFDDEIPAAAVHIAATPLPPLEVRNIQDQASVALYLGAEALCAALAAMAALVRGGLATRLQGEVAAAEEGGEGGGPAPDFPAGDIEAVLGLAVALTGIGGSPEGPAFVRHFVTWTDGAPPPPGEGGTDPQDSVASQMDAALGVVHRPPPSLLAADGRTLTLPRDAILGCFATQKHLEGLAENVATVARRLVWSLRELYQRHIYVLPAQGQEFWTQKLAAVPPHITAAIPTEPPLTSDLLRGLGLAPAANPGLAYGAAGLTTHPQQPAPSYKFGPGPGRPRKEPQGQLYPTAAAAAISAAKSDAALGGAGAAPLMSAATGRPMRAAAAAAPALWLTDMPVGMPSAAAGRGPKASRLGSLLDAPPRSVSPLNRSGSGTFLAQMAQGQAAAGSLPGSLPPLPGLAGMPPVFPGGFASGLLQQPYAPSPGGGRGRGRGRPPGSGRGKASAPKEDWEDEAYAYGDYDYGHVAAKGAGRGRGLKAPKQLQPPAEEDPAFEPERPRSKRQRKPKFEDDFYQYEY